MFNLASRENRSCQYHAPLASLNENDFAQKLDKDSNAVASNCQMHAISHIANFEYGAAATGTCRFDFPRSRVDSTAVTEHEGIEIYQNNVWVNLWSPAFASLIRSNHDIKFYPLQCQSVSVGPVHH